MDETPATVQTLLNWLQAGSINLFGLPFAGKDTQAKLLGELLNAPVIAGGDILRAYPDPEKIKQLSSTGELFPTDLYLKIVLPYLSRPEFADKPLILSSVGRWHGEEEPVLEAAQTSGHPMMAAVSLKLDEDELWRRWEVAQEQQDRGPRYDDDKHTLEVRLEEYRNKTVPVLDAYRQLGLLVEVDGQGTTDVVTQRIINSLLGTFVNK